MARGSKLILPGQDNLLTNPIPRTKRVADITNGDYYPTAPYMMMALLEYEKFFGEIGEFACGGGHIATTLTEQLPNRVIASDLFGRGYGTPGVSIEAILAAKGPRAITNTITNPPYARNVIEKFIRASLLLSKEKCALLMRLQALEGDRRQRIYQEFPLARVYVFVDRPTFYVNRWCTTATRSTASGWRGPMPTPGTCGTGPTPRRSR